MPQDTTYNFGPGDSVVEAVPDSSLQASTSRHHGGHGRRDSPRIGPALVFVAILMAVVFLAPLIWRYFRRMYFTNKALQEYDKKKVSYDAILKKYNPYYQNLDEANKEKFLKRTLAFKASKKFEFSGMEEEEQMPVLISAAAVTLTFGLKNYLLDYFNTIYVLPNIYRYGFSGHPFEGHVSSDGIYLSWNKFLEEYTDAMDGNNVGLHEMAHALAYVNFTANEGGDHDFRRRYLEFSESLGKRIFEKVHAGETAFLGEYASTNYEEFWAVSVEHFFERPQLFKVQMPELYEAVCTLLNQDLLRPGIVIEPVEEV